VITPRMLDRSSARYKLSPGCSSQRCKNLSKSASFDDVAPLCHFSLRGKVFGGGLTYFIVFRYFAPSIKKAKIMDKKHKLFLSLSSALAALGAPTSQAAVETPPEVEAEPSPRNVARVSRDQVNRFVNVGGDLLGFVVTEGADGAVVAEHYSHTSHSSHSSHHSHYSSRY